MAAQAKHGSSYGLFYLAEAGNLPPVASGIVDTAQGQGPSCLLGSSRCWYTQAEGSSLLCSVLCTQKSTGKYWLAEVALATKPQRKQRQTVCALCWTQRAWTCEQRNSLWMLDSPLGSRKQEFRYIHCERYEVPPKKDAIPLSAASFTKDNSKASSCLVFFFFFLFVF